MSDDSRFVRIYEVARTAHIERLAGMVPATFIFRRRSYDFHWDERGSDDVHEATRFQTLKRLITGNWRIIELNEPAAFSTWPSLLLYVAAIRSMSLVRRQRPVIATYAIDNADFVGVFRSYTRLPERVARFLIAHVFRFLLPAGSRLVFGTEAARDAYFEIDPSLRRRLEWTVIPGLAEPCRDCVPAKVRSRVVFVGRFDTRKGILQLIDAWPAISRANPSATLVVAGSGPLEDQVHAFAAERPEVSVIVNPARSRIHNELAVAETLVLLSQPAPRWREQIGLPILEGLSHGCKIVGSSESGVATWLADHGHEVVTVPEARQGSAEDAVLRSLRVERRPSSIIDDLPARDGRLVADEWLFRAFDE